MNFDYGDTKIIWPTADHNVTIVWLHDIGHNGRDSARFVRQLNLPNVKWICPTAPVRPVTSYGGTEYTAWADVSEISEDMEEDLVSFNLVSAFVISLLQDEPSNVMIGLGGFGLGAAVALYYASSFITGTLTINLRFIVGINGWLPARRNFLDNLTFDYGYESFAPSLPILVTQGSSDNVVPFQFGFTCAQILSTAGFPVTFKQNEGDHYTILPEVIDDVRSWLMNLQL